MAHALRLPRCPIRQREGLRKAAAALLPPAQPGRAPSSDPADAAAAVILELVQQRRVQLAGGQRG